jgi:phosphoglycerate dehydrogenase-like enzyme
MYHLHIENSMKAPVFTRASPEDIDKARAAYPVLAERFKITIGCDGDIFDRAMETADFLISSVPPTDRIPLAKRLRWIQTTAAGVDTLMPLDWLPKHMMLTNNSGPHASKCEEYCLMALVALQLGVPQFVHDQAKRIWNPEFTIPVRGKRCLVIGYGDLGQAASRAAKTLGLVTIALSRTGQGEGPANKLLKIDALDDELPKADFVVVAAPLTPSTRNLLNRTRLQMLKPTAGLINVARAAIVDYAALAERLDARAMRGAILDVQSPEPLAATSPLWGTTNLMITPHISCDDPRYIALLFERWIENFARLEASQPLHNLVSREQGY